jgi:hypothetical protein
MSVDVNCVFGLWPVLFSKKTLQRTDGDWPVYFAAAASGFAGMCTNAPADGSQRVRIAGKPVGLFKPSLRDQTDIPAGISVRRAGHHAGEIGVQPVPVNFFVFVSLQHDWRFVQRLPDPVRERIANGPGTSRPQRTNLVKVKFAVVLPATVTGLDCSFAPSFHAVMV